MQAFTGIPVILPRQTPEVCKKIRIENPASEIGWTSKKQAKRYVERGDAEWIVRGVSIRFNHRCEHRKVAVDQSINDTRAAYARAANNGMATLGQIAGVPVLQPVKLITDFSKTPRRVPLKQYRNGPVISVMV